MKLVIVSDNHGRIDVLKQIVLAHPDADAYIHCGDSELSKDQIEPFITVNGNNDRYYTHPELLVLPMGQFKILLLHGHQMNLFKRLDLLTHKAHQLGCKIACYGHTHIFSVVTKSGVTMINPGSLYYNRDGTTASYAVAYVDKQGNVERVDRINA